MKPAGPSPTTVWLNGEKRELHADVTLAGLLEELKIPSHALLVELNGTALRRDEWDARKILPDDRIEMVRIVAGG